MVRSLPVLSGKLTCPPVCLSACPPVCLSCQLYLEALPEDKSQWINKTKELRGRYEKIKEMVRVPPCGQFSQQPPAQVCSSCL